MKIIIIMLVALLANLFSCNNPTQPPVIQNVELKVNDATATEVFLEITTSNINLPVSATLNKDGTLLQNITLVNANTTIVDKSLSPNKNYTYQVIININGKQVTSSSVPAQTMDTTSHNFTWQTFTFGGQAGSSTLYDVAIINENDIWAVGEIYMNDSTGQPEETLYNAIHWDGNGWEPKRIYYSDNTGSYIYQINSLFAFTGNDVWFGNFTHWNGSSFVSIPLNISFSSTINKIWGASSDDLFIVGNNGQIARYINGYWQNIESGVNTNLNDIWGIPDGKGGYNKYVAASDAMLKIDGNNKLTTISGEFNQIIISVWGVSNNLIYTAGNGVVLYKNNTWEKVDRPEVNSIYRIKGEELNEVYGIGSGGLAIKYFNGYSWYTVNTEPGNRFWRIDSKDNFVVASGYRGESAVITILRKN